MQFTYAIGHPLHVSVHIEIFGAIGDDKIRGFAVLKVFSFKPADTVKQLNLLPPVYSKTTNKAAVLKKAAKQLT